jgi:hypothetical protein
MHYPFLRIVVPLSALIPIVVGLYSYSQLSRLAKVIFYFTVFAGLMDGFSSILSIYHIHNLVQLHFYTIAEFLILSTFFINVFTRPGLIKAVKVINIVFSLLWLVNFVFFRGVDQFNTLTRSLEAILIIVYAVLYFEQESRVIHAVRWEKTPANWMVTGILLYFAGSFFLFLFSNIITVHVSKPVLVFIWNLHGVFVVAMYLLFTIGFLNERRSR